MRAQHPAKLFLTWPAALALLAGLALRLWLVFHRPHVNGDAFVYGDIAKNWLLHGIYGLTDGNAIDPTLIRLPGYPAFIAVCFKLFGMENYFSVLVAQAFFDMFSCVLLAMTAQRLFGPRAAMATLWLSSLCLFTAAYVVSALAEPLSIFCIAWAAYALVRWRETLLAKQCRAALLHLISLSIAMIIALLLRPDNGLLAASFLPAVAFLAWRSAGLKHAIFCVAVCTGIFLLALVPWTIRNYRTMHVFQPLAPRQANDPGEFVTAGFNRWYRTWAIDYASTEEVYWSPQTDPIDIIDLPTRAFESPQQRDRTAALIREYNQGPFDSPELDAKFNSLAIERIHQHPFRYYFFLPTARLVNMWLRPRVEQFDFDLRWWKFSDHPLQTEIAFLFGAVNLAYLGLAVWGWFRLRRHDAILWALAAFVILRSALLLTVDNSEPRYTIECFPVVFLFAAAVFIPRRNLKIIH